MQLLQAVRFEQTEAKVRCDLSGIRTETESRIEERRKPRAASERSRKNRQHERMVADLDSLGAVHRCEQWE